MGTTHKTSERQAEIGVAEQLADFVTAQSFADLPPKAVDHAAMLIASTLASAALGTSLESARIVREMEVERGGRAESTIWFGGSGKVPAAAAARVNALASDAAASDDSDLRNIIHCGTTACAAALAMAEAKGASGEDLLAAIVLGYEVTGRINTAMQGGLQTKGFHGCVVSSFAGAVAAARIMKLDRAQMTRTIALTATSMGGLHIAGKGSVAREYHAGNAAMMGVIAAQAAAKGYRPEEKILEMKRGFFDTFGNKPDVEGVTRDMGKTWSILTELGIKLVPGGTPFHAIAEAAANAARDADIVPEAIESITVSFLYPYAGQQFPTDLVGIAHSPYYFAAAGAADRGFTWAHAFEDKINDPRIRGLLAKVRVGDPPTENVERYKSGATVTIVALDGRVSKSTVYAPRGAAMLGIAWADIEAKYRALVPFAKWPEAKLEASLSVIRGIRTARNMSELVDLL